MTVSNRGPVAAGKVVAAVAIPYGFTVVNTGGGTRYGSTVLFTLPGGLAPRATQTWSITLTNNRRGATTASFTAAAVSATADPDYRNNITATTVRTT